MLDYGDFTLYNIYYPNGGAGNKRVPFKMSYYDAFLKHIEKKVLKYLPSTPEHLKAGVDLDWKYWAENGTRLSEKFEAWLMK